MKKWIYHQPTRSPGSGRRLPLFTLLACLACTGCFEIYDHGRDPVRVAGQVLEKGAATPIPIPNAKVILSGYTGSWDNWGGLGTVNDEQVGYTYADDQGYYRFDQVDPVAVSGIFAQKEGYITDFSTMATYPSAGSDMVNVYLPPEAWIAIRLKNESGAWGITIPGETTQGTSRKVILEQGEEKLFFTLTKGNDFFNYVFGITPVENQPVLKNYDSVLINVEGMKITPSVDMYGTAKFEFYLPGHDTTHISITY